MTLEVNGDKNSWESPKNVIFNACYSYYDGTKPLKISGSDAESSDHCANGGLILHCTSDDTNSPWHNFKTDNAHWTTESGEVPCLDNNSGFATAGSQFIENLLGLGANKIWGSTQDVTLIGKPGIDMIKCLTIQSSYSSSQIIHHYLVLGKSIQNHQ